MYRKSVSESPAKDYVSHNAEVVTDLKKGDIVRIREEDKKTWFGIWDSKGTVVAFKLWSYYDEESGQIIEDRFVYGEHFKDIQGKMEKYNIKDDIETPFKPERILRNAKCRYEVRGLPKAFDDSNQFAQACRYGLEFANPKNKKQHEEFVAPIRDDLQNEGTQ